MVEEIRDNHFGGEVIRHYLVHFFRWNSVPLVFANAFDVKVFFTKIKVKRL